MASTRSRSGGREHARRAAGGVAAEHATKIYPIAGAGLAVIIAFLALTGAGHVIDAATQHFMLFYAGVFALIALCASVGLGLVATDRMFLNPAHRVFIQSAHRAASFGAVTFLIIHIATEILAQRVHLIDAVIPFLSPFRTFYLGLGTIASDLVILLVITGILRGRFNASGKAWRWRAMHYTSYAAFVFGVWHGLLGGRPGDPYVDWSYGLVVALVLLGLAVRVLSKSLKPKESLSAPPVPVTSPSASAPLRAAVMAAQLSVARGGVRGAASGGQPVLPPLGAPVIASTALPAGGAPAAPAAQPFYEPGFEGPPRYLGAPRSTGPLPRAAAGPQRVADTGPQPRYQSGSLPPHPSGPLPLMPDTGWQRRYRSGPLPPHPSGPLPAVNTGPRPWPVPGGEPAAPFRGGDVRPGSRTGPLPRPATGPQPRADGGRRPRWEPAQPPRRAPGPSPWPGREEPLRREATGPMPTGPMPTGNGGARSRPAGPPPATTSSYGVPSYSAPSYGAPSYGDPAYGVPSRSVPAHRAGPPTWPDVPAQGWPDDRSGWPETGYDGSWQPARPPWDGGLPEADLTLRYREPGPGMPGYRGSREHRYGGDRP